MGDNKYICSMCKQEYEKGWSDDEARKERLELFGEYKDEDCEIVCDDCFQKIKPVSFEELKKQSRKDMADVYRKISNHALRRLMWKHNKECEKIFTDALLYGVGISHVNLDEVFKIND